MRKNKLSLFTLALASLLWLSACEEEVAGGGGGDTTPTPDCLGDEICFCQTTADCPAGLSCEAGRCGLGGDPDAGDADMTDAQDLSGEDADDDQGDAGTDTDGGDAGGDAIEPDADDLGDPDQGDAPDADDLDTPDADLDAGDAEDAGDPDLTDADTTDADMASPDLTDADMGQPCDNDEREPDDDRRDATPLLSGRTANGTLCPADRDWFLLDLADPRRRLVIAAQTQGALRGTLRDPLEPDTVLEALEPQEGGFGLDWAAPRGQYLLLLEPDQGAPLDYALSYQTPRVPCEDDGAEPNDTLAAAAALSPGADPQPYTICEGNADWYAVEIGGHMRIDVTLGFDAQEVGGQIRAALLSPQGELLTQTNANANSFFFLIDGDQGGTYALRVDSPLAQGPYELTAALSFDQCDDDALEPNDTPDRAEPVQDGFQRQGLELCQNNVDWYAFNAGARQTVTAALALEFPLSDISADIIGPDGVTILSRSQDTPEGNLATALTTAAGTHYVRVFSPNSNRSTYDLTLDIDPCTVDDLEPNNTPDEATAPRANRPYELRVCDQDQDWFTFPQVPAGHHVEIALNPTTPTGSLRARWFTGADRVAPAQTQTLAPGEGRTLRLTTGDAPTDVAVEITATSPDLAYTFTAQVIPAFVCAPDDNEPNNNLVDAVMDLSAPGVWPQLSVCAADLDYLCFLVPPQESITATASFAHAQGDLELQLLTERNLPLAASATDQDVEVATWTNNTQTPGIACVFVTAQRFNPATQNTYTLEVQVSGEVSLCQEDSREDNDGPQAASLLEDRRASIFNPIPIGQIFSNPEDQPAIGTLRGQVICDGDPDWYAFEGQVGDMLEANLRFAHSGGDLALALYRAEGLEPLATVNTLTDDERLRLTLPADDTYFLVVTGDGVEAQTYNLELDLRGACVEDGGEPNDLFFNATPLPPGVYEQRGLCAGGDRDHYVVDLALGDTLDASIFYSPWRVDMDMELYGPGETFLARSADVGGQDRITWTARTAGPHIVRVYPFGNDPIGASATYDLELAVTPSTTECAPDAFEADPEVARRVSLASGLTEINNLTLCQQDVDRFTFALLEAQDLDITVTVPPTTPESAVTLTPPVGPPLRGVGAPAGYLLRALGAAPGLYTLQISRGGLAPAQIPYSVQIQGAPTACANDRFEPNEDRAQAPALGVGAWHGLTRCGQERDCFRVSTAGGERLQAQIAFDHAQGDLDLLLFGPQEELVDASAGISNTERLALTLDDPGLYLLCVVGADDEAVSDYDLRLDRGAGCLPDLFEGNLTRDRAAPFPVNAQARLSACGEPAWFRVTGVAGQELSAAVSGVDDGLTLGLLVTDADGQTLATGAGAQGEQNLNLLLTEGGDLFVGVLNPGGGSGGYDLRVELRDRPATCAQDLNEPDNAPGEATPLPLGAAVNATLCDAADYYLIELPAGQTVEVEAAWLTSRGALQLDLLEADGGALLQAGQRRFNASTASAQSAAARTLLARVRPLGAYRDAYTLRVRAADQRQPCARDQGEPDDALEDAALLASDAGAREGALCGDTRDRFRIDLSAGDHLELALDWPRGAAPLGLRLLDELDNEVAAAPTQSDPRRVLGASLPQGGAWVIEVTGAQPAQTPYRLTWRAQGPYSCARDAREDNDARQSAAPLAPGFYPALSACSEDEDWYAITLQAGDLLEINLRHDRDDADLDLALSDPRGALLTEARLGDGAARLQHRAAEGGTFYLRVWAPGRGDATYDMDVALLDEP